MTADNHKTTGLREAAMLALDALTSVHYDPANPATDKDRLARMALREALAVPDAELTWCRCGDGYPADSFEAGVMSATGKCSNCAAALPDEPVALIDDGALFWNIPTLTYSVPLHLLQGKHWLYTAAPQPAPVQQKPLTVAPIKKGQAARLANRLESWQSREPITGNAVGDAIAFLRRLPDPPVPLTDQEVNDIAHDRRLNVGNWAINAMSVARAVEQAHGIKGEA